MRYGVIWVLFACGGPSQKAIDAAYAAEVMACADAARSRAEAEDCRAQVKSRWGLDGGRDVGGE